MVLEAQISEIRAKLFLSFCLVAKGPKGPGGRRRPLKICIGKTAIAALQLHWNFSLLTLDFLRGLTQRPRELPFIYKGQLSNYNHNSSEIWLSNYISSLDAMALIAFSFPGWRVFVIRAYWSGIHFTDEGGAS